MKFNYIFLIIIVLISCNVHSNAQDYKSDNVLVFINPQYMITSGIRIDIDFRKPESTKWWIISPYYYSDPSANSILHSNFRTSSDLNNYENMYGVGIGVARKIFLKSKTSANGFYAIGGVGYKYFNIQGDNLTYVETIGNDGLTYFQMQDLQYTININSYNAYAALGRQFNPFPRFYIDLYFGFGMKYSFHNSPEKVSVKYSRGNIDYGYTGTQIIAAARLGIALN